jgi:hypothetical protein
MERASKAVMEEMHESIRRIVHRAKQAAAAEVVSLMKEEAAADGVWPTEVMKSTIQVSLNMLSERAIARMNGELQNGESPATPYQELPADTPDDTSQSMCPSVASTRPTVKASKERMLLILKLYNANPYRTAADLAADASCTTGSVYYALRPLKLTQIFPNTLFLKKEEPVPAQKTDAPSTPRQALAMGSARSIIPIPDVPKPVAQTAPPATRSLIPVTAPVRVTRVPIVRSVSPEALAALAITPTQQRIADQIREFPRLNNAQIADRMPGISPSLVKYTRQLISGKK